MPSSNKTNKFLASWCNTGLECLYDLTKWEQDTMWSTLTEGTRPNAPKLNMLILRARVNSQRQYEIYIFETCGLTEADVLDTFEKSPQFMADFIRKNGSKIYSDYHPEKNRIS